MKIVVLLSVLLLISLLARGMGYPQDMFAEHITVKTAEKKTVKSPSNEAFPTKKTSKAAQSPSSGPPIQTYRLIKSFSLYQSDLITMKTFDLEENIMYEQTLPISAATNEKWVCLAMGRSLIQSHQQLIVYLLEKLSYKYSNTSATERYSLVLG
jgi:hypothetical protein